jgi:two-component system, OmpR family, phosphate regulon response regulator PhoB
MSPQSQEQPPWPRRALPPPVVLLVENHADSRALYAFDLRSFGFRVQEAENTTQAIQAAATAVPAVIVADLTFRDPAELQLCRTLKESAATTDVPIIAITANATSEAQRTAEQAGCAAVLVKPCAPAVLRAEIERVLAASQHTRQRANAVRERSPPLAQKSAVLKMKSDLVNAYLAQRAINDTVFAETLARVRAEFVEMPGLHLTVGQAARLLGLDRMTAGRLLDRLVREGFLRRSGAEMYLRAG